jgi:flagellar hook assembly protein FlgD
VPNPFRGTTSIGFELAHRGAVDLGVYAVNGRRIRTLVREVREAGVFRIAWDGRDDHGSLVPAGAYFVRLAAEGRVERESVIRLK